MELDRQRPFRNEKRQQVRLLTPVRLSAAIVAYRTDADTLHRCLASLARSALAARAGGLLSAIDLHLIDNGAPQWPSIDARTLAAWPASLGVPALWSGQGNVGYGAANNLVLAELRSDYHLVMNPDVEVAEEAVAAVLRAFRAHPEAGLLAPAVLGSDGQRQYLCKRYPSLWVLFLRGFAPGFARRMFRSSIERYEMRDSIGEAYLSKVPLASGCFMAVRTALFRKLGGFDPGYFMYFEDYDLSLRIGRDAKVVYSPRARIVHHGGEASRKGWRHVVWFLRSAWRFFATHGWKIT